MKRKTAKAREWWIVWVDIIGAGSLIDNPLNAEIKAMAFQKQYGKKAVEIIHVREILPRKRRKK